jgi:hypothetical protein
MQICRVWAEAGVMPGRIMGRCMWRVGRRTRLWNGGGFPFSIHTLINIVFISPCSHDGPTRFYYSVTRATGERIRWR